MVSDTNTCKTPVVFMVFNRPEETARVFAEIRKARPKRLLIIADGPRSASERPVCDSVRKIVSNIDWSCTVSKNFSEKNIGCGKRIHSGLDWAFSQVDKAIILEDDCVPDPTFFSFCEEMLERYQYDEHVMHVAGTYMQEGNRNFHTKESYYFSIIPNIWGWATWRRAWQHYDFDIKQWPSLKESGELTTWFAHPAAYERFSKVWDQYYQHEIDSWDGQWTFTCIVNQGLCINPSVNLVTNIGFNDKGTHFKGDSTPGNKPLQQMKFPLIHPDIIIPNRTADTFKYRVGFGIDKKLIYRILRPFKNKFPNQYLYFKRLLKQKI